MFHYFNPNPRGLHVGDCTVRSICAVSGQSWEDVHRLQCDLSRWLCDMPSADRVWWTFLRLLGFEQWGLLDTCPMSRGYSRADRMDELVQAMGGAMNDMPEDLRREAQRFITKMQQQM